MADVSGPVYTSTWATLLQTWSDVTGLPVSTVAALFEVEVLPVTPDSESPYNVANRAAWDKAYGISIALAFIVGCAVLGAWWHFIGRHEKAAAAGGAAAPAVASASASASEDGSSSVVAAPAVAPAEGAAPAAATADEEAAAPAAAAAVVVSTESEAAMVANESNTATA